ncbi:probable carboxylesterase 12 [Camellia sinensis]|uniref:Alpha/beta hydrolase fold-3 domain-containing protein n=1 Tax=Camellia sinensis var. sinensis TaxID=542762 RepID=A0A4S4E6E7_CAMSN|nr:probable carboxylesterase 12 [Camellia sinensis]THG11582.1 hypothetical protein TEA_016233 [Camellia sinensis var. sinensis]
MTYKILACLFLYPLFAVVSSECETLKIAPPFPKPEANYKDVEIVNGVCARLYVPKSANPNKKLPLVVYFHGGGFGMYSAFFPPHDTYVYSLVKKANVAALSVDYRQGPKNPLPIPYDDSWEAIKWVASHSAGHGHEEWLNNYVDFKRIFYSGDSAGANIAYNMVMRAGSEKLDGLNVNGIALIHPYFWGSKPIGTHESSDATSRLEADNIWLINSRNAFGLDDPRLNPLVDPKLSTLGCSKVLVLIAEQDIYRDRGFYYYEALRTNGWKGNVEIMETPGTHVFQLNFPDSKYAQEMLERISSFVNKP